MLKVICVLGVLLLSSITGLSQGGLVTDEHGTTFLMDVLPPATQNRVLSRSRANGPLQSNGSGRRKVSQNLNYTGTNLGLPNQEEEELLVNQLLGVVLVPSPAEIRPNGWRGVEGVWHNFKDFPPEVGWAIQKYISKPVSLESLDQMVKDVIVGYREGDRPVVDVLLPEQDITSGVIQLVVIEAKLARIRIEGADVEMEEYIRSQIRVRKGEVIRNSEVLQDLAWLNRSPYRKVDLAYSPGSEFGTTDVILKPYTTDSDSFFVGYEDSGTEFLGRDRLITGFHLGEFGNPGRSLAYQFTSDFDFDRVQGHSVVFSQDLPWRHNLTLLASFVDVNATIPTIPGLPPVEAEGFNWQLSARYNIPLKGIETTICEPLFGPIQRSRDFHFGFDFKSNENDLEFGGAAAVLGNSLDTQVEIYQFTAGYKESWQHRNGASQFDITGFYSPGGFSNHNSDDSFDRARAGSESNYAYARASFEHQRRLLQDWSMRFKTAGQVANGNLQASEQLGVGGYDIVRGFEQRVIRGDEGIWGTFELYAPDISFGRIFDWPHAHGPCTDQLRLLGFFDAASVNNVELLPGEAESQTIASVGAGLRYSYNDFFKLRVDYGHPVMSDRTPVGTDTTGRFHIGATATF